MDITFIEISDDGKGDNRTIERFTEESFVPRVGDFVWLKNNEKYINVQSYRVVSVFINFVDSRRDAHVIVEKRK